MYSYWTDDLWLLLPVPPNCVLVATPLIIISLWRFPYWNAMYCRLENFRVRNVRAFNFCRGENLLTAKISCHQLKCSAIPSLSCTEHLLGGVHPCYNLVLIVIDHGCHKHMMTSFSFPQWHHDVLLIVFNSLSHVHVYRPVYCSFYPFTTSNTYCF